MKTLTTPIRLKNITKIAVDKLTINEDETPPFAVVAFHLEDDDGKVYVSGQLHLFDNQNSDTIIVNPTPLTVTDKILIGKTQIDGAYTAIITAIGTLGKDTKKTVVETTCITLGVFGDGLAAT